MYLLIEKAHAVTVGLCIPGPNDAAGKPTCKDNFANYNDYIYAFLTYAQRVGFILVVLSVIWAGYLYLTSQGDSTKLNSAKDRVLGAILGFILLILLSTILQFIGLYKPPGATT